MTITTLTSTDLSAAWQFGLRRPMTLSFIDVIIKNSNKVTLWYVPPL